MPTRPRLAGFAGLLLLGALSPTPAAVLEVDDSGAAAFSTIQSAIDAAMPGSDEVFVHCGRYVENVVMRDGVTVRGEGAHCTTIDGNLNGSPAVRMQQIGAGTELMGFRIINGRSDRGSGIRIDGGEPTITLNVIEGNGYTLFTGYYDTGGGIAVQPFDSDQPAPIISRNVIKSNSAFQGAGLYMVFAQGAVVTSNLFVDNVGSFGGAMHISGGVSTVHNNTLVFNTADYGGGLWGFDLDVTLAGNILAWNEAGAGADVMLPAGGNIAFLSNNSYGNIPYNYYYPTLPGSDNIAEDPKFVDTTRRGFNGFQPRSDSPLIDAGEPSFTPALDLSGVPGPIDGDLDGTARADIGARENEGLTRLRATGITFSWDPGLHQPNRYNVYRGDLQALRAVQEYTQDPTAGIGARHFCDLVIPAVVDTDTPEAGRAFFYLAAAVGTAEGTLGFDSARQERARTRACQPS